MSTKAEQLKALNAKKKALNEEQKSLREELNATKTERTEARKVQAAARKSVVEQKSKLRDLSASIYKTFSAGESEGIEQLADDLMECATELTTIVRQFGESVKTVEDL